MSCESCGKSWRNIYQHLTAQDIEGVGGTLQQVQAQYNQQIKRLETEALNSTETQADMFALRARSTAKTSTWAQSDVNMALNDNLLDTALLGNDYTKAMSRLQFCSVAVRLAEELTGKEITPAPSGTFTDTDALYARKAYAAGITNGVTATTFGPNGTLTRQQMATFIYRALQ